MTAWRSPANYHLLSDVPANLDYATVADATRLVHELTRVLAEKPPAEQASEPQDRSLHAPPGDGPTS